MSQVKSVPLTIHQMKDGTAVKKAPLLRVM